MSKRIDLVRGICLSALFVLSVGQAYAGGSLKDAPMPPAPMSWAGLYAGANVGYSWGKADTDVSSVRTTRTRVFRTAGSNLISDTTTTDAPVLVGLNADVDGWLGGGQIGYNWQSGSFVFGIETDFQWTGEKGSSSFCAANCAAGLALVAAEHKLDWFGTLRARAGILIDPKVLAYATGGLAYGHLETNYTSGLVGGPTSYFSDSSTKTGWTVGGGLEGFISKNWLLRAEYLYMDFGEIGSGSGSISTSTNTLNSPQEGFNTIVDSSAVRTARTDFVDQVFRIGISYKFD